MINSDTPSPEPLAPQYLTAFAACLLDSGPRATDRFLNDWQINRQLRSQARDLIANCSVTV